MRHYQTLLSDALAKHDWELAEIRAPESWREASSWIITSTSRCFGLQLHVTFLVDPESPQPSDPACVNSIVIAKERSHDGEALGILIELDPTRRNYPLDVQQAMAQLEQARSGSGQVQEGFQVDGNQEQLG